MDIQLFEVFTEVSIAVLGFSGITAAIGSQSHKMGFLAARVKGLLFAAGITSVCSVAPLTSLHLFYCSIAYILFATSLLIWAIFGLLRNPDAQSNMVVFVVGNSLMLSAIVSLIYALIVAPENLLVAYVYSLCMSLLLAGIFFIRLVLAIVSPND